MGASKSNNLFVPVSCYNPFSYLIHLILMQKSGNRKCSAKDDNCQYPGKTDLPDDIIRSFISLMPEYDIQDLLHREVDTSGIYIPYK